MEEYIIIWRAGLRDPFVDVDGNDFIERYPTYEAAKEAADHVNDPKDTHYCSYEIFQTYTP